MNAEALAATANETTDNGEAVLVERAKQDPAAFAELYQRHYQRVARYLYRRTGDAHVTEDLVADVFVTALRRLNSFRWRGVSVRFWFYRIATNAANRWAARRRREMLRQTRNENRTLAATDVARQPSHVVDDAEQIRQVLLTLPPRQQAVIGLHYLEGLSVEETAAALGCRVGTVKSRLSRGREALRVALANKS